MLDTVVISGHDVCCSVVFGTLVGVFVFSVMCSELLMTSAIICPCGHQCTSAREGECAFTPPMRTHSLKDSPSLGYNGVTRGIQIASYTTQMRGYNVFVFKGKLKQWEAAILTYIFGPVVNFLF